MPLYLDGRKAYIFVRADCGFNPPVYLLPSWTAVPFAPLQMTPRRFHKRHAFYITIDFALGQNWFLFRRGGALNGMRFHDHTLSTINRNGEPWNFLDLLVPTARPIALGFTLRAHVPALAPQPSAEDSGESVEISGSPEEIFFLSLVSSDSSEEGETPQERRLREQAETIRRIRSQDEALPPPPDVREKAENLRKAPGNSEPPRGSRSDNEVTPPPGLRKRAGNYNFDGTHDSRSDNKIPPPPGLRKRAGNYNFDGTRDSGPDEEVLEMSNLSINGVEPDGQQLINSEGPANVLVRLWRAIVEWLVKIWLRVVGKSDGLWIPLALMTGLSDPA
ncbi:hypothetical protein ACLMJK_005022 [Lecanora helva]